MKELNQNTFEKLHQFFGGWFHQDWTSEATDWTKIVNNFKCSTTSKEAAEIAKAIEEMLANFPSDEELHHQVYDRLGCYYDPRPDLGG